MNKRRLVLILFGCAVAAQLAVPGWMIVRHELTLARGQTVTFRVRPVDPYDPFRGRYVRLRISENSAPLAPGFRPNPGETVCVPVSRNGEGFATLGRAVGCPPEKGLYLRAKVERVSGGQAELGLPLGRYYVQGPLARPAEEATRQHARQGEVWVEVAIWNGYVVIKQLYVAGKPIRQYLRQKDVSGQ